MGGDDPNCQFNIGVLTDRSGPKIPHLSVRTGEEENAERERERSSVKHRRPQKKFIDVGNSRGRPRSEHNQTRSRERKGVQPARKTRAGSWLKENWSAEGRSRTCL